MKVSELRGSAVEEKPRIGVGDEAEEAETSRNRFRNIFVRVPCLARGFIIDRDVLQLNFDNRNSCLTKQDISFLPDWFRLKS